MSVRRSSTRRKGKVAFFVVRRKRHLAGRGSVSRKRCFGRTGSSKRSTRFGRSVRDRVSQVRLNHLTTFATLDAVSALSTRILRKTITTDRTTNNDFPGELTFRRLLVDGTCGHVASDVHASFSHNRDVPEMSPGVGYPAAALLWLDRRVPDAAGHLDLVMLSHSLCSQLTVDPCMAGQTTLDRCAV